MLASEGESAGRIVDEYRRYTRAEVAKTAPLAGVLLALFGIGSGAVEATCFPDRWIALVVLNATYVAVGVCHLTALRCWPAYTYVETLLAGNSIMLAVIAYFCWVHGNAELCVLVVGTIMTGQALIHPWGWRGQFWGIAGALVAFPLALSHCLVPALPAAYAIFAFVTIAALTLFGANLFDAHRLTAFRHSRDLELANAKQRSEQEFSAALLEVGRVLSAAIDDPQRLCDELVENARQLVGVDWMILYRWMRAEERFVLAASSGVPREVGDELAAAGIEPQLAAVLSQRLGSEGGVEIAAGEQPELVPRPVLERWQIQALRVQTITRDQRLAGMFACAYTTVGKQFTDYQRRLLAAIANQAAVALENASLMEAVRGADRIKTEFVATVSHELRTPMHVILGYTDLLIDGAYGAIPAEQIVILHRVHHQSTQLLDLIQGLLDVNRLEARGLAVRPEWFTLELLFDNVREAIPASWARPDVQLRWEAGPASTRINSDRTKVEMILRNLLHNALKYTEKGHVTVSAEVDAAGGLVRLAVSDTGPGISAEDLPAIFEMFAQGHSGPRAGGVGLGLYIVRRLADALGGSVAVDSRPGVGATFTVTLPIAGPPPSAAA